jgi:hypothetical protein
LFRSLNAATRRDQKPAAKMFVPDLTRGVANFSGHILYCAQFGLFQI